MSSSYGGSPQCTTPSEGGQRKMSIIPGMIENSKRKRSRLNVSINRLQYEKKPTSTLEIFLLVRGG